MTAAEYEYFAGAMARGSSPLYEELARAVAADDEVLRMLDGLPPAKRQPNLLFAAVRHVAGRPAGYADFRERLFAHRDAVVATILTRRTQTNEPARCAGLYPALATLPQPLALLEVGTSAGLCLFPEVYSYEYTTRDGTTTRAGASDSPVRLRCRVDGPPPAVAPGAVEVAWRAGIDLNPLSVTDEDDVRWLRTLVWPEQHERLARLDAAIALARRAPPRIEPGDLNERLTALAAEAPADATLVVFHTAVLDYVPEPGRSAFVEQVRSLPGHWLSQEAPAVFAHLADHLPQAAPDDPAAYAVTLDDRPLALTAMHGTWMRPLTA